MTREGPAYFSQLLESWKIPFSICDLERGDALPQVSEADAVVVLGGSMSANDQTLSMQGLLAWTQQLLEKKVAYLGVCLGLQTLVKAAGGGVVKSPVKELGLRAEPATPYLCELTADGKRDPLFAGIAPTFPIFQLHGETVVLTPSMKLLAAGRPCRNQVVCVQEKAYGFQGHLEVTRQVVEDWSREDDDLKTLNAVDLLRDFSEKEQDLHLHCRHVFFNFLKFAGVLSGKKTVYV
jgi:GMP synthase-like glutamine amidotransferase